MDNTNDKIQSINEDWLYNVIMGVIEPDLTTNNIDTLDEKYRNESNEQKKDRERRYDNAFRLFDEVISGIKDHFLSGAREKKKSLWNRLKRKEKRERELEEQVAEERLDFYSPPK